MSTWVSVAIVIGVIIALLMSYAVGHFVGWHARCCQTDLPGGTLETEIRSLVQTEMYDAREQVAARNARLIANSGEFMADLGALADREKVKLH